MVQVETDDMSGGRRGQAQDPEREAIDRLRRMETRMTGFMQWMGYDTGSDRPVWANGIVNVPTPGASLRDIMAVIPPEWSHEDEVEVHHRGAWIASVVKPDPA